MKIIAIFLISVVMVYSQSREAEQKQFEWKLSETTTTAYLSTIHPSNPQTVKDYFKSNNFILGWHWGGEKIISKVMKSSQCDLTTAWSWPLETNYLIPDSYNDNTNLFVRSSWQAYQGSTSYNLYTHCYYDDQIMFTKSLCYSAALTIDENDPYHLIKLEDDPENNIFGFRFKDGGEVIKDLSDNTWKLKLVKSEADPNNPILADPWPNNLLTYTEDLNYPNINENFSGRCFYVSINLRRLENNGYGDVPVIKIEVPYLYKQGSSLITRLAYFYQVPNNIQGDFNSNAYGRYWNLTDALNQDQQIIITKNMLPEFDSNYNGDITISGYIIFEGNLYNLPYLNHRLKEHNLSVAEGQIDSLNLSVTYLGNCDIAINWIKFETKNTQDLLRGLHDQKIIYGIQKDMNKLTDSGFRSKNIKPKRFTINVEGSPINWPAERHFSKLVGNIISGSNGIALPNHYEYFINPADKWYSFSKITPTVANPFCKVNAWSPIWQTFGLQAGYQERWGTNILNNLHQSEWETYLKYATSNLSTSQFVQEARVQDISIYRADEHVKYTGGPISIQAYWEHIIYNNLIQDFTKGALFQETPWFAQSFVEGYAKNTDNRWVANDPDGTRIVTGEEYKLMNWLPVILGAKGLLYDGDADVSWTGGNTPNIRLLPSENVLMFRTNLNQEQLNALSDYEFINHNKSTSDFLDDSYQHLNIIPSPPDKLTIANTIGTTPDRIFMGKQSVRNEMYKLLYFPTEN